MKQRKLKNYIAYSLYGISAITIFIAAFFVFQNREQFMNRLLNKKVIVKTVTEERKSISPITKKSKTQLNDSVVFHTSYGEPKKVSVSPEEVPLKQKNEEPIRQNVPLTTYTVSYHLMDPLGQFNTKETISCNGQVGERVQGNILDFLGFTSPKKQELVLSKSTSNSIHYYYKRNRYEFSIQKTKGSLISLESTPNGSQIYESPIIISAQVAKGYEWVSWSNGIIQQKATFTMPNSNLMIYPIVKPITYKITYELDGGTIKKPITTYNCEQSIIIPTPEKEGNIFAGWTGSCGSTPVLNLIRNKECGDLSLVANWIDE